MKYYPLIVASLMLIALPGHGETMSKGEKLYTTYCTQCHGLNHGGNGINAPALEVQPRDHTDTQEMSARSDKELFKAIKHGGQAVNKSVLMPNWEANMSDAEIDKLVEYLRELCCNGGS